MRPEEKAKELFDKFKADVKMAMFRNEDAYWITGNVYLIDDGAKQCALICVEEMRGMLPVPNDEWHEERMSYLDEVKKEIENYRLWKN